MKIHWRRLQLSFDISNIDIWSLVDLVIDWIGKQIVTIFRLFWALESLFVNEKCFVVNQNHWKFIEEDSSLYLIYRTFISDCWWLQKSIKLVHIQSVFLSFGLWGLCFLLKNVLLLINMIANSLKKTPAFIWHNRHWYLITGDSSNWWNW